MKIGTGAVMALTKTCRAWATKWAKTHGVEKLGEGKRGAYMWDEAQVTEYAKSLKEGMR